MKRSSFLAALMLLGTACGTVLAQGQPTAPGVPAAATSAQDAKGGDCVPAKARHDHAVEKGAIKPNTGCAPTATPGKASPPHDHRAMK